MSNSKCKPFIKWLGGKTQLLPHLLPYVPDQINHYVEPFLGGGALYFAIHDRIKKGILADSNQELINTYIAVRDHPHDLMGLLEYHREQHTLDENYYYGMRENEPLTLIESGARLIYLNKTCFSGLYRLNKKGKFNAALKKGVIHKKPFYNEESLLACSEALKKVEIVCRDFQDTLNNLNIEDTFIYADPPYVNIGKVYTADWFKDEQQKQLADILLNYKKLGVNVVASNHDTPFIREIYHEFNGEVVTANRRINATRKGGVPNTKWNYTQELILS